ncbi:hypothetical protein BGW36DRAFT_432352 [Talaromyces proteolyticus]|uniref:FAD-binding domain-containing protein n=1 Tax=Talaromyces proteolyticus TaxID=1131652 RepID=A0AAD4KEP8_9EURO|nr:uncharacterized protein BGW36DRAFT_432352 [Talaromyces proteolyticus]KAH8690554.1 hypothetical protein BGW36DRAFT_432352 [Talaromyces proteolyticus]
MEREQTSHIDVLIVGAGLGGLYAAIECYRQGHSPLIVESKSEIDQLGDFVGIGPSVTKQFQKWPGMAKTYSSIIYRPAMTLFTYDGIFVGGPFELSEESHYRPVPVSRPKLIRALYDYATSLGIPIKLGKRVVDYVESDVKNRAYAMTDSGERFEADIIVAADGIGSKAWKVTIGNEVKAISSGWSVYRVTYPTTILHKDPFLAQQYPLKDGDCDYCQVYISPKGQMIILVSPELTTWLFTHEDKGQAEETWSTRLNASDALKSLEQTGLEWNEKVLAVVKQTPPNTVIDYKITWRDPDPIWTSPGGRIVKIGDAAHSFIPNSSNGATQAMEDGLSLAASLRLAGKSNIALATRMHTKLRFERTSCAQKNGFKNREKWERDFEDVKKNPYAAAQSIGRWLSDHDPEQYVYDNWQACLNHITSGAPFKNTNLPPGYSYEPWTMEGLMKMSQNGQLAADPGEWD